MATEKKLNAVTNDYEAMRIEQQKARARKEAGEDDEEGKVTKVKKSFNKKLQIEE